MPNYYLLWPMSDEPSIADELWREEFLRTNGYSCGHYDLSVNPEKVILGVRGEDVPYNFVNLPAIDYLRVDLIDALSPAIESFVTFGRLIDRAGGPIRNLRTIRDGPKVVRRGGRKSYCSRCEICGQLIYNPMGQWHVVSSEIPDTSLFLTHDGGIVVNEELRAKLSVRRWRKLSIDKLRVSDEPLDGFPKRLNEITREQERRPAWEQNE